MMDLLFSDSDYRNVLAYCQELNFEPRYTVIKWKCLSVPQNWFYFYKVFSSGQEKRKKFVYNNAKHFRLRSFQDSIVFLMIAEGEEDGRLAMKTIQKKLDAMTREDRIQASEIFQKSLEYARKSLKQGPVVKP
jgi:uncharacterized FlgJ-related protein